MIFCGSNSRHDTIIVISNILYLKYLICILDLVFIYFRHLENQFMIAAYIYNIPYNILVDI